MSRRGSILVAVLVLASLLVVFVGVAAERLRVASAATRSAAEDIACDVAVRGAVEWLHAATGGRFADLKGIATVTYPGIVVELVAEDEARRVHLDLASEEVIAGLFRAVGVDARRAADHARVIVDWRRDPRRPPDRRRSVRVAAHGTIEHVGELELLPEVPREAIAAIRPFVTVTGLDGRIAVLSAPREVVAALPGLDPGRVDAFLAERRARGGADFEALMRRYGITADHVSKEASPAARLTLSVRVGSHRVRGYEVVVAVVPGDEEPYRFLAWNGNLGSIDFARFGR